MATFSKFLSLINGVARTVDLSSNVLQVQALQIGSILLSSSGSGTAGSTLVGDDNSYSNFTPASATVKAALSAIDSALGTAASALDGTFRIKNTADNSKQLAFNASGISASTTRTITMPDANVDLGALTNSNISASAAIAYSKLALSNSIVNADIAAAAAIALNKLAALTANKAVATDSSGFLVASATSDAELGYVSGVTSAIQTQLNSKLNLSGGTMSGNIDMGSNSITSLADPSSAQDAATKHYVDNLVAGLTWKNAARAASVANVSVSSAPASIDGVSLASGDRVLLKDQSAPAQNGIYVFSAAASPLVRATDMDAWSEVVGSVLLVVEGSVNQGSKWVNTNVSGGTIGTTGITFTAFSVAGTVNGTGTSGYVAYWNGTATLTAEQYLSAARGGLGADASAFTGVLKAASGVFSASTIVDADVSAIAAIAYSKLNLAASIVNADIATGAAIAYSKLALTNSIVAADLTAGSVTAAKLGTVTDGITTDQSGAGSTIEVLYAPAVKRVLIAGQSFSANTSYAVRWGNTANSETAGRIYAADTTTSSFDLFHVLGMASSGSAVSAGQSITVTLRGAFALSSSDTAFGSGTDGAAVYLGASGAFSVTAPTSAGLAVMKIGVVQLRSATAASNVIDVQPDLIGVN